jgi:hypothetical protein
MSAVELVNDCRETASGQVHAEDWCGLAGRFSYARPSS